MPGKKMPPKKGLGLMIMIGAGKPKGPMGKMGKPMKDDYEESPAMERKEYGMLKQATKKPAAKKPMAKKPAAKKPGGIKTMPKGKPGSGSQGRGY
jgi:hypothetical protein